MAARKKTDFTGISNVLDRFKVDEDKYISQEFQKYGYELAKQLDDLDNKSLYIKLAKTIPRGRLETAKNFVKDAYNVKSRGKLFMWKLAQLKKDAKEREKAKMGGEKDEK